MHALCATDAESTTWMAAMPRTSAWRAANVLVSTAASAWSTSSVCWAIRLWAVAHAPRCTAWSAAHGRTKVAASSRPISAASMRDRRRAALTADNAGCSLSLLPVAANGVGSLSSSVALHGSPVATDGTGSLSPPVAANGTGSLSPPVAANGTGSLSPPVAADGTGSLSPPVAADGTGSLSPSVAADGAGSLSPSVAADGAGSLSPSVAADNSGESHPPSGLAIEPCSGGSFCKRGLSALRAIRAAPTRDESRGLSALRAIRAAPTGDESNEGSDGSPSSAIRSGAGLLRPAIIPVAVDCIGSLPSPVPVGDAGGSGSMRRVLSATAARTRDGVAARWFSPLQPFERLSL
eukprot:scaffold18427_cov61-Phaeocystis_antarctica.AAC.4